MSALTVRNLDPDFKTRLGVQAAQQRIAREVFDFLVCQSKQIFDFLVCQSKQEAVRRSLTRAANESVAFPGADYDVGNCVEARFAGVGEIVTQVRRAMHESPFMHAL